ncbi:hypothetical protein FB451DRAFT_1226362 [Mycena latifolia]|nr:hypothetical protein FB451DRAFT_1226362 [Mycena latifolia]
MPVITSPEKRGKVDSVLNYATVAASTLSDIADSSSVPFLRTIAAVSLSILTIAESARTNKDECTRMVSQIDELLSVILHLCTKSDGGGNLSPATLHNIGKFADTLQKIHSFIQAQQNTSRLKRLFRHGENAAQLEQCHAGLRHALDVFGVRSALVVGAEMSDIREQAEKRHRELVGLFATQSEPTESDNVSLVNKRLFDFGNSTTSLLLLPASPKIFHGRDEELHQLVTLLLQDPSRIAILGPGGIGKTSLAIAALHHPDVSARYTRHFISCESATSHEELVSIISSHLGLEPARNASKRLLRHFLGCPPSVLLLDNLETSWEPLGSRSKIEEFLSLLTDIPHLALMITMRGAERPGRVRWTRPFLAPLEPLTDTAALQTFMDITDESLDDRDAREILGFTNNLPLAVNLIANIAAFEGYETVLSRWQEEKTTLFSEGPDKRSNLDLSIRLSLSSPRMLDSPGAHQLLGILSLLPDGISEADLLQIDFPVPEMGRSKTTLIRTSLASLGHDKRLRVLVPIREYIHSHSPPTPALCRPLRKFFRSLITLWKDYQHLSTAGIAPRIATNIGNFKAVLAHGLDRDEPDLTETLHSIITFDSFCRVSGRRSSGMLELVPPYLEQLSDDHLHTEYLTEFFSTWQYHPIPDPATLEGTAVERFRTAGNISGEARFLCVLGTYYRQHDNDIPKALEYYETALGLATQVQDVKIQCVALREGALCNWQLGKYPQAQTQTGDMRRLAQIHGLFFYEAQAIEVELLCRVSRGDLASCVQLSAKGRELLAFCGLQGSSLDLALINSDAEVHIQKTEYAEARALYSRTYADQSPLGSAYDRLNIALIDVETGVEQTKVRRDLEAIKSSMESIMNPSGITLCEVGLAYLDIREGHLVKARDSLKTSFALSRGNDQEISILCLNKLADVTSKMMDVQSAFGWILVLLAFALNGKNTIAIYTALRYLGDVFIAEGDDDTALNLLHVAVDGFTAMDIHRSRGECTLRMGDIFNRRGNGEKATELWQISRTLFARSLQTQDVARIDERLQAYS